MPKKRTSFRNFLGIQNVDDVPDAKTIWRYRDVMAGKGTFDEIFTLFHQELQTKGLIFNEGKIKVVPLHSNSKQRLQRFSHCSDQITGSAGLGDEIK